MPNYLPHTAEQDAAMLSFLGLERLEDLFAHLPAAVRLAGGLPIPAGRSELDVLDGLAALADRNVAAGLTCFAGVGAYDHDIPPVVRALASRSEFVTAYTPYQPEVAQGVLQALFEYQTLVARLSGLAVANASLYDGAASLVEALNLAASTTGRQGVLLSRGVHPHWRAAARTFAAGTGHQIEEVPLVGGVTAWPTGARDDLAAVVVGYPNYLGYLEDVAIARAVADESGALLVVAGDPVAAALVRSAGSWGADVFVGEGQALGTALSFGGPYLGLFAVREELVRRLPGRIVGETADTAGRRAFVTTLRAREQDIRRERATSNVCTNQTLMAVTAAIQLGWLGTDGLHEMALRCASGAHELAERVTQIPGVQAASEAPFVREFALRLGRPVEPVLAAMARRGILGGVAARALDPGDGTRGEGDDVLIVTVTERHRVRDLDAYVAALGEAVAS